MPSESLQIRNCGNTTLESAAPHGGNRLFFQVTIALSIRLARTGLSTNTSNAFLLRDRARYISLPAPRSCEFDTCKSMHPHEDAIYTTTKLSKIISRLTSPKACSSCHPLDGKVVRRIDESASRSVAGPHLHPRKAVQSGKKQSYGVGPKASTRRIRFFRCVIRDSRRSFTLKQRKNGEELNLRQ